MPDRRIVDDLSIEELEQVLRIKKREARLKRLQHFAETGRRRQDLAPDDDPGLLEPPPAFQSSSHYGISHHSFLSEDEEDGQAAQARQRTLRDRLLLGIEIAAGLGLAVLVVFAALTIRDINQASAAEQAAELSSMPTLAPTPLITAVVLPGGHTPPTDPGGARPNYAEVPVHLQPLVEQQFAGPVTLPTASPSGAIRIRIPSINVDAPIVQGDNWEQLKKGVGQHIGSANPGNTGNVVLSAHNDIFGEIFRHLDQLEPEDEIILQTQSREYVYQVSFTRIVEPTEVSVLEQTEEPIATLISCYPYLDNSQRIVVVAELIR